MRYFLSLLLLLAFVAGCSPPSIIGTPDYVYQAEADAAAALTLAASPEAIGGGSSPKPSPDDDSKPKPGKCTACNGSGRSGDGIGRCGTCGGDGRIDEDDVFSPPPIDIPDIGKKPDVVLKVGPDPLKDILREPVKKLTLHVSKDTAEPWMQDWYRNDRLMLKQAGWIIPEPVVHEKLERAYFEVERDGFIKTLYGPQPLEDFQ